MESYLVADAGVEKLRRILFASCAPELTGSLDLNQIGGCVPTATAYLNKPCH